ncbi:Ribonuclease III [Paragonimus westermani]|uniref:Large ribosomal subunit protein mL44 n=1 Tax=Paragonimus westermani TaxID=34504 RepID=A0A8T0DTY7_9TREM|nr:Ribonuclease III [Paragonimus westermani]
MRLFNSVSVLIPVVRYIRVPRWVRPYRRDLYYRRLDIGPEPYRPRSVWPTWNFDAELSAFCHRINEKIPPSKLVHALIDKSYTASNNSSSPEDGKHANNVEYAKAGRNVATSFILAFLRNVFPFVPEEWIVKIGQHLLSPAQLAFTSGCLGLKDLVSYADTPLSPGQVTAPPSTEVMSNVILAVIGVLAEQDYERALLFVRDFLVTPLVDLDLTGELIVIEKPMQLLKGILAANDRDPPESRLQNQAGMNTLTACYQVGIYSSRELLGEAPGETLEIAEQEAARQAVRNLFGLSEHRPLLPLSGPLRPLEIGELAKKNVSLNTYLRLAEETHRRITG